MCVCVCVCACVHTHAHTHTHTSNTGDHCWRNSPIIPKIPITFHFVSFCPVLVYHLILGGLRNNCIRLQSFWSLILKFLLDTLKRRSITIVNKEKKTEKAQWVVRRHMRAQEEQKRMKKVPETHVTPYPPRRLKSLTNVFHTFLCHLG